MTMFNSKLLVQDDSANHGNHITSHRLASRHRGGQGRHPASGGQGHLKNTTAADKCHPNKGGIPPNGNCLSGKMIKKTA